MKIIAFCLSLVFCILCLPVNQAFAAPVLDGVHAYLLGVILLEIFLIAGCIWLIDRVIHFLVKQIKLHIGKKITHKEKTP